MESSVWRQKQNRNSKKQLCTSTLKWTNSMLFELCRMIAVNIYLLVFIKRRTLIGAYRLMVRDKPVYCCDIFGKRRHKRILYDELVYHCTNTTNYCFHTYFTSNVDRIVIVVPESYWLIFMTDFCLKRIFSDGMNLLFSIWFHISSLSTKLRQFIPYGIGKGMRRMSGNKQNFGW